MRIRKGKFNFIIAFFLVVLLFGIHEGRADEFISPDEAIDHVGEYATVCGTVASSRYSVKSKGSPTFLNIDEPYPNQIFTALIWGADRDKFESPPEEYFEGKDICVEGVISTYRRKAQIVINEPSQITLKDSELG